jgi:hypothetical protein
MLDELTSLEASEDDALLSMLLVLDETLWDSLELPASGVLDTLDALASLKTSVDELTTLKLLGLTVLDSAELDSAELVSPVLSVEELVSVEANEVDSLELTALVLSLELTTLETVALLTAEEVVLPVLSPVLLLPEPPQPASVRHETASVHTNLESVVAIIASLYNFYC